MLVATLSQLNLSSTLMRFLPQMGAKSARRLINLSYLATSLTALVGSVVFVTVLPRLSSEWRFVGDSAFFAVIFAVSVVVWEIFTLQDAALVGLQRPVAIPIKMWSTRWRSWHCWWSQHRYSARQTSYCPGLPR